MFAFDLQTIGVPLARQIALFLHLMAFAFAFVLVAKGDVAMLLGKYRKNTARLREDARAVAWLLVALWVTGFALIALNTGFNWQPIADNPKVLAKLTVVAVLTLNGGLLHALAFPVLARDGGTASATALTGCVILGAVSSVSWVAASLIGASRIIAPLMGYHHYMAAYGAALAVGLAVALLVARPLIARQFAGRAPGVASLSASAAE
jgi:hypothetical protein